MYNGSDHEVVVEVVVEHSFLTLRASIHNCN